MKSIRRDPYYVVLIDFGEFQPGNTGSTILENNLKITSNLFGRFNYSLYICRVNQDTDIMDEREKESSRHYYNGQLDNVDFHSEYAPTIKISGTKYMDLNEVSITFCSDGFIYTKIKARRVTDAFYEILEGMFKGNWVHVWDVIN